MLGRGWRTTVFRKKKKKKLWEIYGSRVFWYCCHHRSSQCTEFAVCGDGAGKPCPDKQSIEQWLSVHCSQTSSTWLQPKYPSNTIICNTYSSTSIQLQQLYCILWQHTSKQHIYAMSTCCDFKEAAACLASFQGLVRSSLAVQNFLGSFIMWCVPQNAFLRQHSEKLKQVKHVMIYTTVVNFRLRSTRSWNPG